MTKKQIDRLIKSVLEAMKNPTIFKKKWRGQQNYMTKQDYKGRNNLTLASVQALENYSSNYWITNKQLLSLGGKTTEKTKRYPITYWNILDEDEENDKKFILRIYTVCNLETTTLQVEDNNENENQNEKSIVFDYLMKERIRVEKGQNACYYPKSDKIQMPDLKTFYNTDDYYHVLNHEVIHSTAKRLNRQVDLVANPFGSKEYSKEELVAEFGAKILSDMTNLQTTGSFEYIANRAQKIEKEGLQKELYSAIKQAIKAVDYIKSFNS